MMIDQLGDVIESLDDFDKDAFDIVRADRAGICELEDAEEADWLQTLAQSGRAARNAHRIARFYRTDLVKAMEHEGIKLPNKDDEEGHRLNDRG
ncbi:hypothetical protein FPZ12_006890 [Amycolatopsis acidicola]|uniref:Uncharacterized protein n=1 Tax=Amycolatopsis acidicola TaxID=2596893 RepID=A0A5N0VIH8_9PSEU|nr:hypothetical protein [Amycolatopsis acidicola]KAA9164970.1 hypothetical protein FPZ12_006890 [Amycolatopsis acidicola]